MMKWPRFALFFVIAHCVTWTVEGNVETLNVTKTLKLLNAYDTFLQSNVPVYREWRLVKEGPFAFMLLTIWDYRTDYSPGCFTGAVEVLYKANGKDAYMFYVCGNATPYYTALTTANTVTVRYRADNSRLEMGFRLLYRRVETSDVSNFPVQGPLTTELDTRKEICPPPSEPVTIFTGSEEKRVLPVFSERDSPRMYPNNAHCVWNVFPSSPYTYVQIRMSFDIPSNSTDCTDDYLEVITRGVSSESFRECNARGYHSVIYYGIAVQINFRSDASGNKGNGFGFLHRGLSPIPP